MKRCKKNAGKKVHCNVTKKEQQKPGGLCISPDTPPQSSKKKNPKRERREEGTLRENPDPDPTTNSVIVPRIRELKNKAGDRGRRRGL